jgi:hypothetical protein
MNRSRSKIQKDLPRLRAIFPKAWVLSSPTKSIYFVFISDNRRGRIYCHSRTKQVVKVTQSIGGNTAGRPRVGVGPDVPSFCGTLLNISVIMS